MRSNSRKSIQLAESTQNLFSSSSMKETTGQGHSLIQIPSSLVSSSTIPLFNNNSTIDLHNNNNLMAIHHSDTLLLNLNHRSGRAKSAVVNKQPQQTSKRAKSQGDDGGYNLDVNVKLKPMLMPVNVVG